MKKSAFPLLKKDLVYLDSAATSQKPKVVIDRLTKFYREENANIHRGVYPLSERATEVYEDARKTVANFIGAKSREIIFTRGTTESINLLAYSLPSIVTKKEIVVTALEHHANLLPWQRLISKGWTLKVIPITKDFELDYGAAEKLISSTTGIIAISHVSNTTGTVIDIARIVQLAKNVDALVVVDAAQSVGHISIDVKKLDCDFLAFSSHKMLGPTGIGVLYGKESLLEKMPPFLVGGNMVASVTKDSATWLPIPQKFEAGTMPIAEAIGLAEAIRFIQSTGLENIAKHEQKLRSYALKKLVTIPSISVYAPKKGAGIISFTLKGIHPHDVASLLGAKNICIRGGHHCNMPLMTQLGVDGTARISFHVYSSKQDVDALISGLQHVQKVFHES